MTAGQYRAALGRLKLSQEAAGAHFGVGPRTSQNYALGATRVPESVAKLVRAALRVGLEKLAELTR